MEKLPRKKGAKASISADLFEVARHFSEPVEYVSEKFSGMLRSGETEISLFFGGDFGRGPEEGDRLGRWIADAINAALQQPGTAAVLAGILERIKSGEESQAACVEYRHVAGEISAFGALFAEALSRRKSRPSKKP